VGFLIGGGSLAYRLDSTWKLIDWRRRRTAAVPGSTLWPIQFWRSVCRTDAAAPGM